MSLPESALAELREAKALLENPGLAVKLADLLGSTLESGLKRLPERWSETVEKATAKAITTALDVALKTMRDDDRPRSASNRWHKLVAGATGAAGGAFGLTALLVELPVTTAIMLRSIADIARSEGEDPRDPETRVACIAVLALGGPSKDDDGAETGYLAVRLGLRKLTSEVLAQATGRGAGGPVLSRFTSEIAKRFSIRVSEKAAAQALPVLGAVGGALVNTLFLDHFQDVARGHFIVRRLERLHGEETVRSAYKTA